MEACPGGGVDGLPDRPRSRASCHSPHHNSARDRGSGRRVLSVEECYRSLSFIASRGGPYAAIFDLSGVTVTTLSPDAVRGLAGRAPAIPAGRPRVIVAEEPWIFGLARMFQ